MTDFNELLDIYSIKKLEIFLNKISLSGVYSGWGNDSKIFFSVDFKDKDKVVITFGKERKTNSISTVQENEISSLGENIYTLDSLKNDVLEDKEENYILIEQLKGLCYKPFMTGKKNRALKKISQ